MQENYKRLPVYEQRQAVLDALEGSQAVVVQSPTGSGKTTQLPIILYEAGYGEGGIIGVTQPRRIAALSVSEFIARQLKTKFPGLVGCKMRFEDNTGADTRIKIMTDGILLQEMKLDPMMSRYSVIMVDEAHERSLNIDFALGLLKRVMAARPSFKVIVSSATMNAGRFSRYFDGCPIVSIETPMFPVAMVWDPPALKTTTATQEGVDALLHKIEQTISRILANKDGGDVLVFLPGEKVIKDCMKTLYSSSFRSKIHIVPLYGRLPKDEQERVFDAAPLGKKKVVLSTNIAETSVTINGITSVIDSGLAKLNFYSPKTFTSSLTETPISRASSDQRRGRAGRTCPGTCYRLYSKKDYSERQEFTTEEIYRTDLSEVVLRMSELGITDFAGFDFISPPGLEGLQGAVQTLHMLGAIDEEGYLTNIGRLMVTFPTEPRVSRIIVESIMRFPDVLDQTLIAASFLSASSPFVLPPGEEMEARRAHHAFSDERGDFVSYLKVFSSYTQARRKNRFCTSNYLDEQVMAEIANIKEQLEQIVSERIKIPITKGGSLDSYLCCVSVGMIQFVCIRDGRETYRSLTQERIAIHPGSSVFKTHPEFIVAGEIVRTSRMFAMSVSPLSRKVLRQIDPKLEDALREAARRGRRGEKDDEAHERKRGSPGDELSLGGKTFGFARVKGRRVLLLPLEDLKAATKQKADSESARLREIRVAVVAKNGYKLLAGEKLAVAFKAARVLDLTPVKPSFPKKAVDLHDAAGFALLAQNVPLLMRPCEIKGAAKEYGFVCLTEEGEGVFRFRVVRGFGEAVKVSFQALESLIEATKIVDVGASQKRKIGDAYRLLRGLYE